MVKSQLPMTVLPFFNKWKSNIKSLNFWCNFLNPKMMKSVMEQLVLLVSTLILFVYWYIY